MSRTKMLPPLPDTLGDTEQDRFKNFAKAILGVPKSEAVPQYITANLPIKHEKVLMKLDDDKPVLHPERQPRKRKTAAKKTKR
jgi:hypothetical protein